MVLTAVLSALPFISLVAVTIPIVTVLIVLIIVGLCLWLAETYIPMSPPIKTVVRVVVVLFLILYLLSLIGVGPGIVLR